MGIPKFYRWLSERYPLLNMPVTATEAPPEIDNLYLDMNGIIHNCTHANDPNLKLTETEMVVRIFTYLDKLIHIMKPQKLVFMAIDGVAPRAKMNQQRSRRFKSALDRLALEAEKKAKGEETPDEYKFDSNCITPGTGFMARLGKHLRFFIRKKMSEDPVWQQPVVIFSGHDVPGEGEHKIMEYIRWQKRSPTYAPNQRHCMYGLDADLIMLSLVTHEPHFCLLREVVSFTGKNRGQPSRETLANPCAENFILFQIGLLREYIEMEFTAAFADKQLTFALDVERVVDDIVLFCMLVGNDFLPALPTLDIAEGALNQLIETYKSLLPQLGGYLTHAGELNHDRLQVLLGAVADRELQTLEERAADTEWFESKRSKRGGGRGGGTGRPSTATSRSSRPQTAADRQQQPSPMTSFAALEDLADLEGPDAVAAGLAAAGARGGAVPVTALVPTDLEGLELEPDEPEVGPTMMSKEARQLFLNGGGEDALRAWKERYYKEKLEQPDASPASTSNVVHHYIRGLHWVLQYYYRGVASWEWYYPFHYAPMAQDMRVLQNIDVSFNRGKPFKPFEQLLAVLPAASSSLLPTPYQWLMTNDSSPIKDFYPEKFDIDMEGKRAEWEGVVKVPFIDEARLLKAMELVPLESLTAEERKRNIPGDMLVFEHTAGRHESEHCDTTLPKHFSSIVHAHSICRHVPVPDPIPSKDRGFVPALSKGTVTGKKNPPGFPTLKTMSNLNVELKLAGVNVFGHPAKKDSLILLLPDVRRTIATDAAAPLLRGMLCGLVYVKWPYLQEAEIVAVSDSKQRISVEGITQHSQEAAGKWQMVAGQTKNTFLTKMGIDIGPLPIMLDVRVCKGYKRGADGSIAKEYEKELVPYPLQAVLQSRPKPPSGFADPDAPKALSLKPGTKVVWVGPNYFGCVGTVLADPAAKVTGKAQSAGYLVRVQPLHREVLLAESRAHQTVKQCATEYMPSGVASRMVRLNPRLLGRLTGNMWVEDSSGNRVDIGLAVKNAKQGLCVPSLCRPAEGTGWTYSNALVDIVAQYKARYPNIIAALEPNNNAAAPVDGSLEGSRGGREGQQRVTMDDLFPGLEADVQDARLQEVASWLKSLPSSKQPLVAVTAQLASTAAIERLQVQLPPLLPIGTASVVPVELEHVHPSLLLPPHDPAAPQSVLAAGDFEPGDRIVILKGTGAPAFGARGTVIGVLPNVVEVLMDEDYAGGSTLNGRVRGARGGYMPPEQLLNVSKQNPVRGAGPKPRQASPAAIAAATAVRMSSKDTTAAATADGSAAAAGGGGGVTSPRAVATRLVELAPWLKGKQMQGLTTAQQQHQALQQQLEREEKAAAAQQLQQQPQQQPQPQQPVPTAPATQGGRLLQLLKQNQGMLPSTTGPGSAAGATAAAAALAALQMSPQQQPTSSDSAAAAATAATAALQPPEQQQQPTMQQLLGRAMRGLQQQQPQQQPPVQAAAQAAGSRTPVEPSPSAGRTLLRRLQKGTNSTPSSVVAAASAHQQQQQPITQAVQQQPVVLQGIIQKPNRPQQQQQQQQAQPASPAAPATAAPAIGEQQPALQSHAAAPVAPAAGTGAHLLAMLQKPAAAAAPRVIQPEQQVPKVKVVPRPQPAAVAAAAAANQPAQQNSTAIQQAKAAAPHSSKVKVVPRPQAAQGSKAEQQQQQQQQQQQRDVKVVPRPQAGAAAAATAQTSAPEQQQQKLRDVRVVPRSQANKHQQPTTPTEETLAAAEPTLQQQQQCQLQPQEQPQAVEAAEANPQTPPRLFAAALNTRPTNSSSDETGSKAAPRTPPAGAGSSLMRGSVVIQARLPDGTRGFTMGRGTRLSASSGGGSAPTTPPAPGSLAAAGPPAAAAATAAAAMTAAPGAVAVHGVPSSVQNGVAAGTGVAAPAVFDVQSGMAQLSLGGAGQASSGSYGTPEAQQAAAAPPGPTAGGQALMAMLQRGAVRGSSAAGAMQAPQQPPQQPAVLSPAAVQPAAAVVSPDPVAVANTNAACNLLKRLQRQQSQQK